MTSQQVTDKTEAVQGLISALNKSPEEAGRLALEFVLEQVKSGADLPKDVLQELIDAIPETTDGPDRKPSAEKQAFLAKYGIKVLAESQVALVLPQGVSRIEFLREAQKLANELHGQDAVWPNRLTNWAGFRAFTDTATEALKIAVDGNVKGSTNHTRRQQEEKGWNNVDIQDLAVAHAAYFIATGEDLFAGNAVRARGGALRFDSRGLDVDNYYVGDSYSFVSASRGLPFPN